MNSKIACYGIPSIFSFKSDVCEKCIEFTDCQKEAHSALTALREYPIATTMLKQHDEYVARSGRVVPSASSVNLLKSIPVQAQGKLTRYALTEGQITRISSLPKKIGNFLEKVWVRGLDKQIKEDILNGKNPFNERNARPYHAAYDLLISGRAHRSKLSSHLMEKLGWTYASAYSQVSMIWQIFPELGIAEVEDVFLVKVYPTVEHHNNEKYKQGALCQ